MMIRILTKCVSRGSDKETAKMRTWLFQQRALSPGMTSSFILFVSSSFCYINYEVI